MARLKSKTPAKRRQPEKAGAQRAKKYSFEDIHRALFPDGPPEPRTVEEMDEAIAEYVIEKHARR